MTSQITVKLRLMAFVSIKTIRTVETIIQQNTSIERLERLKSEVKYKTLI